MMRKRTQAVCMGGVRVPAYPCRGGRKGVGEEHASAVLQGNTKDSQDTDDDGYKVPR